MRTRTSFDLGEGAPQGIPHSLLKTSSWCFETDDLQSRMAIFDGLEFQKCVSGLSSSGVSGSVENEPKIEDLCGSRLWKSVLLELASNLTQAASLRPCLAPVLLEALDKSLEYLLLFGKESDLRALEEWLSTQ